MIPVEELTDQHCHAEYREIRHVPASLKRSLNARGLSGVLKAIPAQFTLNTGHVMHFYDKGLYLSKRFDALRAELIKRGYNIPEGVVFDSENIYTTHKCLNNDYVPDEKAYKIIRQRIEEKINMKRGWYRYYGQPLVVNTLGELNATNN
jgi:deoxyribonuclease (pyrimidine dimer)